VTRAKKARWVWIDQQVVLAIHDEQLAEHGGRPGIRDMGLLESALAQPRRRSASGDPDLADIAAAYGYALARNHAFVDGNKRTAFVAVELCLAMHGAELVADDAACVLAVLGVAAGDIDEAAFATWIRSHCRT
jgi:death-on-curing protein